MVTRGCPHVSDVIKFCEPAVAVIAAQHYHLSIFYATCFGSEVFESGLVLLVLVLVRKAISNVTERRNGKGEKLGG